MSAGDDGPIDLLRLLKMDVPEREAELFACCASSRWVAAMAQRLPSFRDIDDMLTTAEQVWWELTAHDWREALDAHPKIGTRTATGSREGREQSSMASAGPALRAAIEEGNRAYEHRFGMTYVVRAAGRSPAEMLLILRQRLGNDPETELRVAAAEQAEITRLRLIELVNRKAMA